MIREHAFNTEWWGSPVGIIDDPAFFALDPREQANACAPYAWVECSAPLEESPRPEKLRIAGFHWVDAQIPFRINLTTIASTASTQSLTAVSAAEAAFDIAWDDFKAFAHERFRFLPGITARRINDRYAMWSNRLIAQHPAWCLQILDGADVQGWFLCQAPAGKPLELTLAMLRDSARISGHLLYQRAMIEFAIRGARIGAAAFSIDNTAVLNIYASLGARFLPARGYWLRWPI